MGGQTVITTPLSALVRVAITDPDGEPVYNVIGVDADGKPKVAPSTKLVLVRRGDPLPDNIAAGELERLKADNAIGTAVEAAAVGQRTTESDVTAAAEQTAAKKAARDDEAILARANELTDPELVEFFETSDLGVRKLTARAKDDPVLAQRFIDAEKTARAGDARSSLIEGLEREAKKGGGSS